MDLSKVSFIIDNEGHKSAAILPYELYQQLISLKALIGEANDVSTRGEFSYCVKQAQAYGYPQGAKSKPAFVVTKNSTASFSDAQSLRSSIRALRDTLLREHVICVDGEVYRFMRDYRFTSPSAAACVIAGSPRSGLDAWTDQWGKTLKHLGYGKRR